LFAVVSFVNPHEITLYGLWTNRQIHDRKQAQLLSQQRAQKRLRPVSGDVPGQPT